MYALIENNIVKEVFSEKPDLHPSLEVRECDDFVTEGFVFDRGTFLSPDNLKSVSDVKVEKLQEVSACRDKKYNEGFVFENNTFQIDAEAQRNMLAIQTQFLLGNSNAHGGFWRDVDNKSIAMNDQKVQEFFQAAFNYALNIKKNSWDHKENINNLNAKNDILEYNHLTGW